MKYTLYFNLFLLQGRFRYRAHYPVGELTLGSLPSSRFDAETQERGLRIVPRGDSQLLILCPSKEVRFLWRSELQRCVEAQLFPSDKARRGAKTPQAAEAARKFLARIIVFSFFNVSFFQPRNRSPRSKLSIRVKLHGKSRWWLVLQKDSSNCSRQRSGDAAMRPNKTRLRPPLP